MIDSLAKNMLKLVCGKGKFYKYEYKVLKNSQGIYKIKIKDKRIGWRFIKDVDTMLAIVSSHREKDQLFFSKEDVDKFIKTYIETKPIDYIETDTTKLADDFEVIYEK